MESNFPENIHDFDNVPGSPFYVETEESLLAKKCLAKYLADLKEQSEEDERIACEDKC